jgi:transcriptional regulator with XRE-family HTH domain
MIDKSVPFIVRRARLLLGITRAQFAGLYGVVEETVSHWERGLAHPSPEIWARLRTLTVKAGSLLDEDLVRVSPLDKFIVDIKDLTRPIVMSKGMLEALEAVEASDAASRPFDFAEIARENPAYEVSGTRALEIIQADPRWSTGEIVYAESHCLAPTLGGIWVNGMIAPLPERLAALIEFAPSKRGAQGGFWVHVVGLQDMPFNQPQ